MDLTKRDIRAITYYLYLKGLKGTKAAIDINSTLQGNFTNERKVQRWFKKWTSGDLTLEDEERSGRPVEISDEEIIKMIKKDSTISTVELSFKLDCSPSGVRKRLNLLGYICVSDKWVPRETRRQSHSNKKSMDENDPQSSNYDEL